MDELIEALEFYRGGFQFVPKRTKTGINISEWIPKPELLDDCGNRAVEALQSARSPNGPSAQIGIDLAVRFIEKRRDNYVQEHGAYDPSTGITEFPGNGDEYVGELEEIIDGIRALQNRDDSAAS